MAVNASFSSHGFGEGHHVAQLRDLARFLGFSCPEYTGYSVDRVPPHCELSVYLYPRGGIHGAGLRPHLFIFFIDSETTDMLSMDVSSAESDVYKIHMKLN